MNDTAVQIRPWCDQDDVSALTALLHRAYKPLADAGMRFVASHQDDETTRKRLARGRGFVAVLDGRILGAIVYHPPGVSDGCPWYRLPGVAMFGQFAVEPSCQKQGFGAKLIRHAESEARRDSAVELALDTSEHAAGLIAYYARLGFRIVGHTRWESVNYRSVLMSKCLRGPLTPTVH